MCVCVCVCVHACVYTRVCVYVSVFDMYVYMYVCVWKDTVCSSNLRSFLPRCGTRPYEWGTEYVMETLYYTELEDCNFIA